MTSPKFSTNIWLRSLKPDYSIRHYKEVIPPGSRVLDLASSWVSHLPEQDELDLKSVVGLGMNEYELKHNKRLSR